MITFVSALYRIHDDEFDNVTLMNNNYSHLLNSPLNVIVFVDDYYYHLLDIYKPKLILKNLDEIKIYQHIITNNVSLPANRNTTKDTLKYIALMNSKIEFLNLALPHVTTPYMGWIDAGIGKIFKQPKSTFDLLSHYRVNSNQIIIPSCYRYSLNFNQLKDQIWWVFCGGFFVLPLTLTDHFYQLSLNKVKFCVSQGVIFWEVNVWVLIDNDHPNLFYKYQGDHNESIIHIPQHLLCAND